jgi:hypothetical protein
MKYLTSLVTTVFDVTQTSLHMRPLGFTDDIMLLTISDAKCQALFFFFSKVIYLLSILKFMVNLRIYIVSTVN